MSINIQVDNRLRFVALIIALLMSASCLGGPLISAGDPALRQDIQRLADAAIIKGPTTTWPLAWVPILDDLQDADASSLHPAIVSSLTRVRYRASWETRTNQIIYKAKVGAPENPTRIRSFHDTPRGDVEVTAGAAWIGDWFNFELNVQGVDSDEDNEELRADDSMIGVMLGNWTVSASTQQRWWGPGWDGSLILSNNARSIPSPVIDRVFTDSFKTKWLSWIGPWDMSVLFGQMEKERHVPTHNSLACDLIFDRFRL